MVKSEQELPEKLVENIGVEPPPAPIERQGRFYWPKAHLRLKMILNCCWSKASKGEARLRHGGDGEFLLLKGFGGRR
jgi:hypothetical protein